jgi:TonB family protein
MKRWLISFSALFCMYSFAPIVSAQSPIYASRDSGMPPPGVFVFNGMRYSEAEYSWKVLDQGVSYAVKPLENKPFIALVATRGETLSEPVTLGFYVLESPVCKALANPIDGPVTGPVGSVGLVEIDGKNYALDGWCDGGNLTLVPSYWVNRQALLSSVMNDPVMSVRFKPGPVLNYNTAGFSKVLADLNVTLPPNQPARSAAATSQVFSPNTSLPCSTPIPEYPVQAIRQGHQGVAYVTLKVGADGHPNDVQVFKSSGFPELDAAAVQAMSSAVCNATPGTTMGTPVKFSLQGSM